MSWTTEDLLIRVDLSVRPVATARALADVVGASVRVRFHNEAPDKWWATDNDGDTWLLHRVADRLILTDADGRTADGHHAAGEPWEAAATLVRHAMIQAGARWPDEPEAG